MALQSYNDPVSKRVKKVAAWTRNLSLTSAVIGIFYFNLMHVYAGLQDVNWIHLACVC